jgi:hypothetical protein
MTGLNIQQTTKIYSNNNPKILDKNVEIKEAPPKSFANDAVKVTLKVAGTGVATSLATGLPLITLASVAKSESLGLAGAGVTAAAAVTAMIVSATGIESKSKGAAFGAGYGTIAGLTVGGLSFIFERNTAFLLAATAAGALGGAIGGTAGAQSNKIFK